MGGEREGIGEVIDKAVERTSLDIKQAIEGLVEEAGDGLRRMDLARRNVKIGLPFSKKDNGNGDGTEEITFFATPEGRILTPNGNEIMIMPVNGVGPDSFGGEDTFVIGNGSSRKEMYVISKEDKDEMLTRIENKVNTVLADNKGLKKIKKELEEASETLETKLYDNELEFTKIYEDYEVDVELFLSDLYDKKVEFENIEKELENAHGTAAENDSLKEQLESKADELESVDKQLTDAKYRYGTDFADFENVKEELETRNTEIEALGEQLEESQKKYDADFAEYENMKIEIKGLKEYSKDIASYAEQAIEMVNTARAERDKAIEAMEEAFKHKKLALKRAAKLNVEYLKAKKAIPLVDDLKNILNGIDDGSITKS